MSLSWRQRLRRTWFAAGAAVAILAITLAVLMALGQLLLPLAAHYPNRVAHWLGERLHQPVSFRSMEGYWQPSGPVLVLHDVRIGSGENTPALSVPSATVKVDFGALLRPSRHWVNLRLSDLKLRLVRNRQGQWHVAGLRAGTQGASQPVALGDLPGNLWLDDLDLDVQDQHAEHHYHIHASALRVSNSRGQLRFAGVLRGKGGSTVRVAGRVDDGGDDGRLYLAMADGDLGAMFEDVSLGDDRILAGKGNLTLWLDWHDRQIVDLTVRADLQDLAVQGPDQKVRVSALRGLARYVHHGDQATVLLATADKGAARIDWAHATSGLWWDARVRNVDAGSWLTLATLAPGLPRPLAQWLVDARPQMHLATAHVRWSHARGLQALNAHFDHLNFHAVGASPGVHQLHGVVRGDASAVSINLPGQPVTLDFGGAFRKPLDFTTLGADMVLWRSHGAWVIGSDGVDFAAQGLAGQLRGQVVLPAGGKAPIMRMYAALTRGDMALVRQYLPIHAISPGGVAWLDRALAGGSIDHARVLMHGDMADWPFAHHQGRFQADLAFSGATLDFQPGWPPARDLKAQAQFIDTGMLVKVASARVRDVKVSKVVGSIFDFGDAELVLQIEGDGSGSQLLDLVRHSPIGESQADDLSGLKLGGRGDFDLSMVIPIAASNSNPVTLSGKVDLHDVGLTNTEWGLQLDDLNGQLNLDEDGLQGPGLAAHFHGQPVRLDIGVGGRGGHPSWPVTVRMRGRFNMQQLAQGREGLAALVGVSKGSAPFDIRYHVDTRADNPLHSRQVLSVRSNLQGMSLDLPAPLHKSTQALLPLNLALGLPFDGNRMRVVLGNKLYVRARLPAPGKAGSVDVMLGGGAPVGALPALGIRIRGSAAAMDLSGWMQYALSSSVGVPTDASVLDLDVTAQDAQIFGGDFKNMEIKLVPDAKQWKLTLDGPSMQGSLTIPRHNLDQRGIVARYQRLYWPSADASQPAADVPRDANQDPPKPSGLLAIGVTPSSLPPLHISVADLRLGDAHLGEARLESWPTAKGMHINMLRIQSDSVHISGSGDWNGTAQASQTHLAIDFSAENLGSMLDAFGYQGVFIGGATQARLDATWPGTPASFDLANLTGDLAVKIGRGRIPEVKPGMGRLFGLMSIVELPRRLAMDFGSIFGKGFGFDSINGNFRFKDGNAWTHDLAIKGAAADITISGRVDMRGHTYDQYVLAIPHLGNSLPIVGAVVAGPIGVAAGLAVQGILGKGLNKVASARYHITGPWSKPVITLLEKHIPKSAGIPAPATSAPAAASSVAVPSSVLPVAAPASSALAAGAENDVVVPA